VGNRLDFNQTSIPVIVGGQNWRAPLRRELSVIDTDFPPLIG